MNLSRNSPAWKLMGLLVVALAIFILWVSLGLLPTVSEAQGKGTFYPLIFTWVMILVSEACTLGLAWYLFMATGRAAR